MATVVRLNPAALDRLMHSPQGPVMRHLAQRGDRVIARAKPKVGVSEGGSGRHLRDTIVKRFVRKGRKAAIQVGTFAPADKAALAVMHQKGTVPHEIRPRKGKFLVFFWPKVGRVVFLRRVSHPGTRPNPYLTDAAREEGLRVVAGR